MTEKTDFPDIPEDSGSEENTDSETPTFELGGLDPLAELPVIPEPPAEPVIVPLPYVAPEIIVDKMQALIQQKKDEAAERERLASMPKQPYRREEPRVGRNDPCPCGSGKKYKKCHMGKDLDAA